LKIRLQEGKDKPTGEPVKTKKSRITATKVKEGKTTEKRRSRGFEDKFTLELID